VVTSRRIMTRITMRRMTTSMMRTISPPPVTKIMTRMKIMMRTMTRMRTRRITTSLIPVTKRKKMRMRKNTAAGGATVAGKMRVTSLPAGGVRVRAAGATREDVHPATGNLPVAVATMTGVVLLPWTVSRSVVLPAKADGLIMKKEGIMDMMKAGAGPAAAVPVPPTGVVQAAVLPAEAVPAEVHPAAAAQALPAEAVTPVSPAMPAVSSPAVADARVMAAAPGAAAAVPALPAEAAVPVSPVIPADALPAADVLPVAAAQAAAAVPAAGKPHDSFHNNKQIGPARLYLFVFQTFFKSSCHETSIHGPPQQRTEVKEYYPKETKQYREPAG
jgi:hypothetical protein